MNKNWIVYSPKTGRSYSFAWLIGLMCCLIAACGQPRLIWGQEAHSHGGAGSAAEEHDHVFVTPETPEFKAAAGALTEHLKKMREILVHYNLSISDEEDKKDRQVWIELLDEGVQLHQAMIAAAADEYGMDPAGKADLADMLFQLLKRSVEDDRYDGLLPVVRQFVENPYADEEFVSLLLTTAIALDEFELARTIVQKFFDPALGADYIAEVTQNINQTEERWERELRLRAEDAAGEPLPRVLIRTTKGNMEVELFENQAPETVANFVHLVEDGFYDRLTFFLVSKHAVAQTGCPLNDGTGNAGYFIRGEMGDPDARDFFRGTLGMAIAQTRDSASSQFFFTMMPLEQLNGQYTAFGRVVSGIEVLSNLTRVDPNAKEDESEPKGMVDEVIEISVLSKRDHEYTPNKVGTP
jgi:cyclophilin family peptidyl-prolyl cis-trans isomerase